MMRILICLTAAAVLLSACGQDRVTFGGVYYRGSIDATRDDRKSFVASVRPVSDGFEGARAAAEYEGIKYCISLVGRSDIVWRIGPDTDASAVPIDRDRLIYQGRCIE